MTISWILATIHLRASPWIWRLFISAGDARHAKKSLDRWGCADQDGGMYIILGGTGHVGTAAANALLDHGAAVTLVCRDAAKASALRARGARVAITDVNDVDGLRPVLARGTRLLLLNPPARPATDMDAVERASVAAILAALEGARLDKVVAISSYGAQPGRQLADLGSLYEMEQGLAELPVPATVLRAAYYMSNWQVQLASARDEGLIRSFFPVGFALPMVDPTDVGGVAAALLAGPATVVRRYHVEGPQRYSARDVAAAFARALGRTVRAVEIPPQRWVETLGELGFSDRAALSFANSFAATLTEPYPEAHTALQGITTLEAWAGACVKAWRGGGDGARP